MSSLTSRRPKLMKASIGFLDSLVAPLPHPLVFSCLLSLFLVTILLGNETSTLPQNTQCVWGRKWQFLCIDLFSTLSGARLHLATHEFYMGDAVSLLTVSKDTGPGRCLEARDELRDKASRPQLDSNPTCPCSISTASCSSSRKPRSVCSGFSLPYEPPSGSVSVQSLHVYFHGEMLGFQMAPLTFYNEPETYPEVERRV